MKLSVREEFLKDGQRRFSEFRHERSLNPSKGSEDLYTKFGEETFSRYSADPNAFLRTSGVSRDVLSPPLTQNASKRKEEESAMDVLDRLVNMSVEEPLLPKPLVTDRMTYDFEQTKKIHEMPSRQPTPLSFSKETEWIGNSSPVKNIAVQKWSVDAKPSNSEVASTHESESVQGMRFNDRMERKATFATLQEHIQSLTEENCDLRRALELQQKLTANLTQENQTLGDEYNIQAAKLDDALKTVQRYERLIKEQEESLTVMRASHEMAQSAEQGAHQRVKALATENVQLEEKIRDLRISGIRTEKALNATKEELESLNRTHRRIENENRNLSDILNNIREENNLLRSQMHSKTQSSNSPSPKTQIPIPQQKPFVSMIDVGIQSVSEEPEQNLVSNLPLENVSERDFEREWTDEEILRSFKRDPSSNLDPEEQRILSSVHELMDALDIQRKAMIAKLRASKMEILELKSENKALTTALSNRTQQREIKAQRELGKLLQSTGKDDVSATLSRIPATSLKQSLEKETTRSLFGWFGGNPYQKTRQSYLD